MKFILILGNGFDLDLGLKSSFSSFINSYEFKTIADIPLIVYIREKYEDNPFWCDIEGAFREAICSQRYEDIDINLAWQSITMAWERYIQNITQKQIINININSCAYALLSQVQSSDNWFSFNYTSPCYLSGNGEDKQCFVHNNFVPREFNMIEDIQIIHKNLIIGVDSNIYNNVRNKEMLVPIIKRYNNYYNDVNLITALYNADNIIIFGHSLGITDSDYFKPLFDNILNGNLQTKTIYIITDKESSFEKIRANMKTYNIDYNTLIKRATIVPIYTMNGPNDMTFKYIIDLMK